MTTQKRNSHNQHNQPQMMAGATTCGKSTLVVLERQKAETAVFCLFYFGD
jgi:hypothetical protein